MRCVVLAALAAALLVAGEILGGAFVLYPVPTRIRVLALDASSFRPVTGALVTIEYSGQAEATAHTTGAGTAHFDHELSYCRAEGYLLGRWSEPPNRAFVPFVYHVRAHGYADVVARPVTGEWQPRSKVPAGRQALLTITVKLHPTRPAT